MRVAGLVECRRCGTADPVAAVVVAVVVGVEQVLPDRRRRRSAGVIDDQAIVGDVEPAVVDAQRRDNGHSSGIAIVGLLRHDGVAIVHRQRSAAKLGGGGERAALDAGDAGVTEVSAEDGRAASSLIEPAGSGDRGGIGGGVAAVKDQCAVVGDGAGSETAAAIVIADDQRTGADGRRAGVNDALPGEHDRAVAGLDDISRTVLFDQVAA